MTRAESAAERAARVARLHRARLVRSIAVQLPFFVVVIGAVIALGFVLADRWRRGALGLGVVCVVAAAFRAFLPSTRAGFLRVRGRAFDVAAMGGVGALVLWMASSIDPLGTG